MPTKQPATPRSPAASAASGAPSPTAPTTAKALEASFEEVTLRVDVPKPDEGVDATRIEMTRQPVADTNYEGLPDKTIREMMAGRAALNTEADKRSSVSALMTQTAQEMFSKQATIRLTDKRIELQKGTLWSAEATLDVAKQEWTVTITVERPGVPPAVLSEPFPQFPSDEMIAWLTMVG